MSFPYIEEDFISLSECERLIDYATLNKSENVSRDDVYSTDIEWIDPVSYTHLTLPTICSV